MAPKEEPGLVLQGVPKMIYADSGPISKSRVSRRHEPARRRRESSHAQGFRRQARDSRSKGKVERPFRTVKEAHETLYHFHQPENEAEAMTWLINACAVDGVGIDDILEPFGGRSPGLETAHAAVDRTASHACAGALETGFQANAKPISEAIADSVLSKQIDSVEATLTRNGYTTKVLTELLGVKPGELRGTLQARTRRGACAQPQGANAGRRSAGLRGRSDLGSGGGWLRPRR